MDWASYRRLADTPRIHTRYLLERTACALAALPDPALAARLSARLEQVLSGAPVPRPHDHQGDPRTQLYEVVLTAAEVAVLVALFQDTRALPAGDSQRGGADPWRGFLAAWREHYNDLRNC